MMNQKFYLLFFTGALLLNFGCKKPPTLKEADKSFDRMQYHNSAEMYDEVYGGEIPKDKKAEVAFKTAEGHMAYNNYKDAEKWFKKAIKDKYGPLAQKRLADCLKNQEKYTEAIIEYNNYLKDNPNDEEALKGKEGCELALKWKGERSRYEVSNMKKLNTGANEYSAVYLKKEAIIFTTDREGGTGKNQYLWTGENFTDLWISEAKTKRGETNYGSPTPLLGLVNTNYNDGVPTIDGKGSVMYYTQCNGAKGKEANCKLMMSIRKGKGPWEEVQVLSFNDTLYNFGQPTLSEDGERLYFVSDMPGGKGKKDIWVVNYVKRGKTWGQPINLGPMINTEGNDMYPYAASGDTLYFASDGHPGMGGLDIFMTIGSGETWTKPVNLKAPINSGADDFSFIINPNDRNEGFISSNRKEGGKGQDDIWQWKLKPLVFTLSGVVRDENTKEIIANAKIPIINSRDTGTLFIETDDAGSYKIFLTAETDYELFASKKEDYYFDSRKEFQTTKGLKESTDLIQDFNLRRLDIEGMFNVRGILYGLDSADIRPESAKILDDSVVSLLKQFPRVTIELGSHTDCRADSAYNVKLSQRRADSAVNYIISRGIEKERIVAKGYGENELEIKKCVCDQSDWKRICTEAEHQLNRRTTVKVTSVNYMSAAEKARVEKEKVEKEEKKKGPAPAPEAKSKEDKTREREEKAQKAKEERERKAQERKEKQEKLKKEREEKMKERQKKQKKG